VAWYLGLQDARFFFQRNACSEKKRYGGCVLNRAGRKKKDMEKVKK